jgi:hypothetical protein
MKTIKHIGILIMLYLCFALTAA